MGSSIFKESDFTLMIVDDNPQNLMVLGSILQRTGYKVAAAKDGKAAVDLAFRLKPDLVLMDVMMPEMDGYEATRIIKANPDFEDVPVIFISANTEAEGIVEGFNAGGVDYVSKPFKKLELLRRLMHHLELRQSKLIIKEQAETLRSIIATKDKLFSIIAHDLRNPLVNIKMLLAGLASKKIHLDPEKYTKMMGMFQKSVDETYSMLENLLAWARSQRGTMELNKEQFKMSDLLAETMPLFNEPSANKGLELRILDGTDKIVECDKNMINTVIRNLVSNAIKFTPVGGFIEINSEETEDGVLVSIKDSGVGIDPNVIPKLFLETENITTYGTNNEKGSGLGLNLCRDFVEKNGGKIWIESVISEGSTFFFTLNSPKPEESEN